MPTEAAKDRIDPAGNETSRSLLAWVPNPCSKRWRPIVIGDVPITDCFRPSRPSSCLRSTIANGCFAGASVPPTSRPMPAIVRRDPATRPDCWLRCRCAECTPESACSLHYYRLRVPTHHQRSPPDADANAATGGSKQYSTILHDGRPAEINLGYRWGKVAKLLQDVVRHVCAAVLTRRMGRFTMVRVASWYRPAKC